MMAVAGEVAATAVPVRGTNCGEPVALLVRLTVAVLVPEAVGLKVTLMEQVAFTARVAGQVVVWAKSPGAVPASMILIPVRSPVPLLVRVRT